MSFKNYNLYLLAIPSDEDNNLIKELANVKVQYCLAAQTEQIDEEILCKMMKEMYRVAANIQDNNI